MLDEICRVELSLTCKDRVVHTSVNIVQEGAGALDKFWALLAVRYVRADLLIHNQNPVFSPSRISRAGAGAGCRGGVSGITSRES